MQINKTKWDELGLAYTPAPIRFREGNHTYVHEPSGDLVTGVTTILGVMNKPFLVAWSTKENYNYMLENWDITKTYTQKEKEDLLLLAKNAYARKADKAKDVGSIVHEMIHYHIRGEAYPVQEQLIKTDDKVAIDNSFNSFLQFEKEHNVIWLLTEEVIFCKNHFYAGCLDGLALVDGVLTMVDFKTSNQISDEYYIQLGAYEQGLNEQMGISTLQRLIIRIPKDGGEVEPVLVPTDLKFDIETFNHLREVHRWNVNIKNNHSFDSNGFKKLSYKKLNK